MKLISRSHENSTECEDAVDRKDVLDGAITHYSVSDANIVYRNAVPVEYIESLSSVTPQRKTGRWLDNYQNGYKCSECGAYLEIDCGDAEMNFCPNCGAEMNERE